MSISVEDVEGNTDLLIVETNSEVVHGFLELFLIERSASVVIGNLEFSSDTGESSSTSGLNFSLDVLKNLTLFSVGDEAWFLLDDSWLWSAEDVVVLGGSSLTSLISPAFGSITLSGVLGELPGVGDHGHEVHVIIDGAGDVVIVLDEFLLGDNVVWGIVVSH